MSSWAIVALIALVIWGVVQLAKTRAGIVTDEDGNETYVPRDDGSNRAELEAAQRELEELRERIKVLERIATDSNSTEARERARIAAEIEALRLPTEDLSSKEDQKK
jgi:uncharacterized protein YlxW (UPF0749 family)